MNEKNKKFERNISSLEIENKDMKFQYKYLKTENLTNKNQLLLSN